MVNIVQKVNSRKFYAICLLLFLTLILSAPATSHAAEEEDKGVLLLEPELLGRGFLPDALKDIVDDEGRVTDLGKYLNGLFVLGIGIASGLAVIYITIGGIQYMTTASSDNKTAAREKITAAVGGLLLALVSFIILNTIKPISYW